MTMNKKQLKKRRRAKLLKKKANIKRNSLCKQIGLSQISDVLNNEILPNAKRGVMNVETGKTRYWDDMSDVEKRKFNEEKKEMYDALNSSPTMIHENDFIPHDCFLCDARIETVHDSHNPFPLTDIASALSENGKENPTRCCSSCDKKIVLPARIVSRKQGTHKEQWAKYHDGSIYYELAGIQKEVA